MDRKRVDGRCDVLGESSLYEEFISSPKPQVVTPKEILLKFFKI